MPYKFIAAVDSKSFDGACNAINGTRSRLNWAAKHLIKEHNQEFNEVLALGYFEKQAIDVSIVQCHCAATGTTL